MRNVICMKWGTKYGPEYVNKLYAMVRRNLSGPVRFVCLTDDPSGVVEGVECRPIPTLKVSSEKYDRAGWRKLAIFSPELSDIEGTVLFLDVDLVIVDSIDPFFDHAPGEFCIIENWTQRGRNVGNSSVFRYEAGRYGYILEDYERRHVEVVGRWDNEQMYLTAQASPVRFWPEDWCKSFKHHSIPPGLNAWFRRPAKPEGVRIVVFHGNPKPSDAIAGRWPDKPFRRVKKTFWVDRHWR